MDYTRARLFISKNNLYQDQIDELMLIIQDIQHQVLADCEKMTMKIMEKKI